MRTRSLDQEPQDERRIRPTRNAILSSFTREDSHGTLDAYAGPCNPSLHRRSRRPVPLFTRRETRRCGWSIRQRLRDWCGTRHARVQRAIEHPGAATVTVIFVSHRGDVYPAGVDQSIRLSRRLARRSARARLAHCWALASERPRERCSSSSAWVAPRLPAPAHSRPSAPSAHLPSREEVS